MGNLNIFESPSMSWLDLVEKSSQSVESSGVNEHADILERIKSHTFRNNLGLNYEISDAHSIGINWNVGFSGGNFDSNSHGTTDINLLSTPKTFNNLLALNYAGRILPNGDRLSDSAEWMRYKKSAAGMVFQRRQTRHQCQYAAIHIATPRNKG